MSETAPSEAVDEKTDQVVEIDTVLPHSVDHVWRVLTTNDGAQALLGPGARLGGKGEPWHADDGSHGVWRSYHPLEQVRVSWHADANGPGRWSTSTSPPRATGRGCRCVTSQPVPTAPPSSSAGRPRSTASTRWPDPVRPSTPSRRQPAGTMSTSAARTYAVRWPSDTW